MDVATLEANIEQTVTQIEKKESSPFTEFVKGFQAQKSLRDKLSYVFDSFSRLFSVFSSLSNAGGQEVGSALVSFDKLDYTKQSLDQLAGPVETRPFPVPSVQDALQTKPYSAESTLGQLLDKIQQSTSIPRRLAWTAAYSNALSVYQQKYEGTDIDYQ